MKRLLSLLPQLEKLTKLEYLNHIRLDSREVSTGDLFIALKGHKVDARQFIPNAIKQGATLILAEAEQEAQEVELHPDYVKFQSEALACYVLSVPKLAQKVSHVADLFLDKPSVNILLAGVTGTNGKTTVSHLLAQWRKLLGGKSAVMGTVGNGLYGELKVALNTTGSAIEIQQNLVDFVQKGADFCAIEVSSHGLAQYRVESLRFDLAIFTNFSRDHLDYHQTMEDYKRAKFRLFDELESEYKIINADDVTGDEWLNQQTQREKIVAVSCFPNFTGDYERWVRATGVEFTQNGSIIEFESCWGDGVLETKLLGAFNVHNVLLALAGLLCLGFDLQKLIDTAPLLTGVSGRMEAIEVEGKAKVIVDYAHTPDALRKVLKTLRYHCEADLWCVFGCGGERDAGKRPLMAEVAAEFADHIIVTDDNPRSENPEAIINDILTGFSVREHIQVIHQREEAIKTAIENAKPNDVILIAGKGHENYQIIGEEKHYFSDQEMAKKYLK